DAPVHHARLQLPRPVDGSAAGPAAAGPQRPVQRRPGEPPLLMRRALEALAVAAALLAAGCTGPVRLSAAGDIHAFLVATRDDDSPTFLAHVDRPALKEQLSAKLVADAERRGGDTAGAVAEIAGPAVVSLAVDALVKPRVFRAVAEW